MKQNKQSYFFQTQIGSFRVLVHLQFDSKNCKASWHALLKGASN
jgi:hypothetical protein